MACVPLFVGPWRLLECGGAAGWTPRDNPAEWIRVFPRLIRPVDGREMPAAEVRVRDRRLSCVLQVGQHGENAPVSIPIVIVAAEAQLREHGGDVCLDSLAGHEQVSANTGV